MILYFVLSGMSKIKRLTLGSEYGDSTLKNASPRIFNQVTKDCLSLEIFRCYRNSIESLPFLLSE